MVPVSVNVPTPERWLIVLSHDCEFNEGKRTHFVVARLDAINPKTTPEEHDKLRYANDYSRAVDDGVEIPLDTFYLDPVPGAFDAAMRANFACLASFPIGEVERLRKKKQAELLQEQRVLLRRKIGVFFGRDADDIPDEEKTPIEVAREANEQDERA